MRFLSSRTHAILDYLVGFLLIGAPWILGFANEGLQTWVPVVIGTSTIIYSLLTNYELGLLRVIPFPVHLGIDMAAGLFLAASPWLLGFHEVVYLPHLIAGIFEVLVVLVTNPHVASMARGSLGSRGSDNTRRGSSPASPASDGSSSANR